MLSIILNPEKRELYEFKKELQRCRKEFQKNCNHLFWLSDISTANMKCIYCKKEEN